MLNHCFVSAVSSTTSSRAPSSSSTANSALSINSCSSTSDPAVLFSEGDSENINSLSLSFASVETGLVSGSEGSIFSITSVL